MKSIKPDLFLRITMNTKNLYWYTVETRKDFYSEWEPCLDSDGDAAVFFNLIEAEDFYKQKIEEHKKWKYQVLKTYE